MRYTTSHIFLGLLLGYLLLHLLLRHLLGPRRTRMEISEWVFHWDRRMVPGNARIMTEEMEMRRTEVFNLVRIQMEDYTSSQDGEVLQSAEAILRDSILTMVEEEEDFLVDDLPR